MDKWIAECIPCGVTTTHDTEDEAIMDVETHVFAHHITVPAHIRAQQKMGHVQQRTILEAPAESIPAEAGTLLPTGDEPATVEPE